MRRVQLLVLLSLSISILFTACDKEDKLEGEILELSWDGKNFPVQYVSAYDHSTEGGALSFKIVPSGKPVIYISVPNPGKHAAGEYVLGEEDGVGIFKAHAYDRGIDGQAYIFSSGNLHVKNHGERYEVKLNVVTEDGEVISFHFRDELTFYLDSPPLHIGYPDETILLWNGVERGLQYVSSEDNEVGKYFFIDFLTDTEGSVNRLQIHVPYVHDSSVGTYVLEEIEPSRDFIHSISINENQFQLVSGTMEVKKKYNTYEIKLNVTAENGDVITGLHRGKLEQVIIK